MKLSFQKLIYHADPCLVLCVITFIIFIPIGFSIDSVHLETNCNQGPNLYLPSDISSSIPEPFVTFINNSKEIIELVVSSFYPHHNFTGWVTLLKSAVDRGVRIKVVTDDESIKSSLDFCEVTFAKKDINLFVFIAQSDYKRTIYASRLFNDWDVIPDPNFILSFCDCKSIANDVSSLVNLLKYYYNNGFPNLFDHKFLPGSSFPQVHNWNSGSCSFGITPQLLVPPNRQSLTSQLNEFFEDVNNNDNDENLSILTPTLFPEAEKLESVMPELLLSEQMELSAFKGKHIRILLSVNPTYENAELNSLKQFPGIVVKNKEYTYSPTFFLYGNECGFMPMSLQYAFVEYSITFSIKIKDEKVTKKLQDHFNSLWDSVP